MVICTLISSTAYYLPVMSTIKFVTCTQFLPNAIDFSLFEIKKTCALRSLSRLEFLKALQPLLSYFLNNYD
ncbi:unnamed protein product [Caenorhabditis nigoni]